MNYHKCQHCGAEFSNTAMGWLNYCMHQETMHPEKFKYSINRNYEIKEDELIMDNKLDVKLIEETAKKELYEERFRLAVEKEKERLKKKKSIWDIIFPYNVVFIKKGEN